MFDYLLKASPIILALLFYFLRLERRLGIIITDIDWIKTFIISNTNPGHEPHDPDPENDLPAHS